MKNEKRSVSCLCVGMFGLFMSLPVVADVFNIDCPTDSLQLTIDGTKPGDTINVSGVCSEALHISTDDLKFIGNGSGTNVEINGENLFFATLIKIQSAVRVSFEGFDIRNGLFGLHAVAGASFSLSDSNISEMIIGMNLENNSNAKLKNVLIDKSSAIGLDAKSGSSVEVLDALSITNSTAFGLEVIDGGEIRVTKGAVLTLTGNLVGSQISGGSTMFVDTGASVIADNNVLIGFSVNTGASMVMFNSDLSASGNGLDGLDVVSSASLDVDGDSTLTVNNNRREGISLDNGSLNIFGFFSTKPNLPRIVANNNANNGIQIEFGGKLDIGRNSSLEILDNGKAGISLDDGSSANIHDSVITGNNGMLLKSHDNDEKEPADIILTFGSRVSFRGNNEVGLALCDKTSMVRGDVECDD